MYRQIIIPTSKNYVLRLPDELIGQKVEVIAFAIEQHTEVSTNKIYPKQIAFRKHGTGLREFWQSISFFLKAKF